MLKSRAGDPHLLVLLGIALLEQGKIDDAIQALKKATRRKSGSPESHFNLGLALTKSGDFAGAAQAFEAVLAIEPKDVEALINLGQTLLSLRRPAEAAPILRCALEIQPGNAATWRSLAISLFNISQSEQAIAAAEKAAKIDPEDKSSLDLLGVFFSKKRDLKRALEVYRAARALSDDVHATAQVVSASHSVCDWSTIAADEARVLSAIRQGYAADPITLAWFCDDPALLRTNAANIVGLTEANMPIVSRIRPPAPRSGKVRVGYLSGDLHNHATAVLFAGVPEHHDRDRFEIVALSTTDDQGSPMRQRLRAAFPTWRDVGGLSDDALAQAIAAERLDILVDLNGYATQIRQGAVYQKPAPVIVNWLGYPGTMGTGVHDYIVADPTVIPAGDERYYSEAVARLPDCYQCTDDRREFPLERPSREQVGLPEGRFVFASFNAVTKLRPEIFDAWLDLLRGSDAVLWMLAPDETVRGNLRAYAVDRGVAVDQLVFAGLEPLERHLARLPLADMMVDSFPYGAHTTASDYLWMGVPIVTIEGASFASRVCASLLRAIGAPELIASDVEGFKRIARELQDDRARLAALRTRLEANRMTAPLFDTARFTRNLEAAFTEMARRARAGLEPAAFDVEAGGGVR